MKTEKEIMDHVRLICEKMRGVNGFILSTGDAVPHGTSIELLKKINAFVEKYD